MSPFRPSEVRTKRDDNGNLVRNPRAGVRLMPHRSILHRHDQEPPRNTDVLLRLSHHAMRRFNIVAIRAADENRTPRRNRRV